MVAFARADAFFAHKARYRLISPFSPSFGEREKKGRFLKESVGGKRLLPDDDGRFERRAFM